MVLPNPIQSYDGYIDIEIYEKHGDGYWAQKKYLVHGINDIMWTNDPKDVAEYIEEMLETIEETGSVQAAKQKLREK